MSQLISAVASVVGGSTPDSLSKERRKTIKLAVGVLALIGGAALIVVNLRDGHSDGPARIFDAVASGDHAAVKAAVADPAARDATDPDGNTPLHKAVLTNEPAIITTLLAAGASAEARNVAGLTPLCYAVFNRERDTSHVARALLDGGASADVRLSGDYPLVHRAIELRRGDDPVLRLILSKASRAVLESKDAKGRTALAVATTTSHPQAVALIQKTLSR